MLCAICFYLFVYLYERIRFWQNNMIFVSVLINNQYNAMVAKRHDTGLYFYLYTLLENIYELD